MRVKDACGTDPSRRTYLVDEVLLRLMGRARSEAKPPRGLGSPYSDLVRWSRAARRQVETEGMGGGTVSARAGAMARARTQVRSMT